VAFFLAAENNDFSGLVKTLIFKLYLGFKYTKITHIVHLNNQHIFPTIGLTSSITNTINQVSFP
jgi:hypothetical protein